MSLTLPRWGVKSSTCRLGNRFIPQGQCDWTTEGQGMEKGMDRRATRFKGVFWSHQYSNLEEHAAESGFVCSLPERGAQFPTSHTDGKTRNRSDKQPNFWTKKSPWSFLSLCFFIFKSQTNTRLHCKNKIVSLKTNACGRINFRFVNIWSSHNF